MHGGALSLADEFIRSYKNKPLPDLIVASDMLDLSTYLALTGKHISNLPPCITYFHENQLTYPWSPDDKDTELKRDNHYAFINYTTALLSDKVLFNSDYHRHSFLEALPYFLKQFPDKRDLKNLDVITQKSEVLHLGMDLKKLDAHKLPDDIDKGEKDVPLILWNHRWEYDKNPDDFFKAMCILQEEAYDFRLAIVGESYTKTPAVFKEARIRLADKIIAWGYQQNFKDYARLLWAGRPFTCYFLSRLFRWQCRRSHVL